MSPRQLRAMREGRRRWEQSQRAAALKRVSDFTAWLKDGSVLLEIPEIPKDTDYRLVRDGR